MNQRWSFRYSAPRPYEGPCVEMTATEAERTLLAGLAEAKDHPQEALWKLARFYCEVRRTTEALGCLRQLLEAAVEPEARAAVLLAMGQAMEHARDYPAAIAYYVRALALEPAQNRTWYLIHNSLGSSFNQLGQYREAELYCRRALSIHPHRPDAYTQLGIALEGLGQSREAAQAFIQATRADASDPRACACLDELLTRHPELAWEFETEQQCCRQAVAFARHQQPAPTEVVYRGWRKSLLVLLWHGQRLFQRFCRRPAPGPRLTREAVPERQIS